MAAALGLGGVPDALVVGGARLACHDAWVDRAWWWGWGVGLGLGSGIRVGDGVGVGLWVRVGVRGRYYGWG